MNKLRQISIKRSKSEGCNFDNFMKILKNEEREGFIQNKKSDFIESGDLYEKEVRETCK